MKQNIAILMLLSGASAMNMRSLQDETVLEAPTETLVQEESLVGSDVVEGSDDGEDSDNGEDSSDSLDNEDESLEGLDYEGEQSLLGRKAKCPLRCKCPLCKPKVCAKPKYQYPKYKSEYDGYADQYKKYDYDCNSYGGYKKDNYPACDYKQCAKQCRKPYSYLDNDNVNGYKQKCYNKPCAKPYRQACAKPYRKQYAKQCRKPYSYLDNDNDYGYKQKCYNKPYAKPCRKPKGKSYGEGKDVYGGYGGYAPEKLCGGDRCYPRTCESCAKKIHLNPSCVRKAQALIGSDNACGPHGTVTLSQDGENSPVCIHADVDGLTPGKHGFAINTYGDISNGCDSTGEIYNPYGCVHGGPDDITRKVGDLGNLDADCCGHAWYDRVDDEISMWGQANVMGRAFAVKEDEDNLGQGCCPCSQIDGCAGPCIGYGLIGAGHL